VALSGLLAGLSGAFLAIEVNALYQEGQTQGLGFIALAALILGNWSPSRLMVGALLFGFAQAVPLRLGDAPIIGVLPDQFVRMIPYIVTIVAIAGFVGRVQPPAAAGKAYEGTGGT
jgi:simple sugar transport system permease protein